MTRSTIFIAALFTGLAFSSCGKKEEPQKKIIRPVKAMVVSRTQDLAARGFPAVTNASQRSEISFRVAGPIITYKVVEGALVKKGELVAAIDPTDYKIALEGARARYVQTKAEAERYKRLWQKGSVAKNDYERKQANYLQAKAKLDEASNNLRYTKLYAPFSGYYGPKLSEVGEEVRPGQPVAVISNLSVLEVVTTIPEQVAVQYRFFDSYDVTFDTYPGQVFKATIKNLEKTPTPEGFRLHLYLEHKNDPNDPAQAKISAGMSCRVSIHFKSDATINQEIVVPVSAVVEGGADTRPSVWLLKPYKADTLTVQRQPVTVGEMRGRDIVQIRSGLKPGDRIVTAGAKRLVEGEKVKILQKNSI